jgi:acyl-CoA thioesterase I
MVSHCTRRGFCVFAAALTAGGGSGAQERRMFLYTFGDSILDCAGYNDRGVHPGQLLVRNEDSLFPEFKGRDLASRTAAKLEHRAMDGATVDGLRAQAGGLQEDRNAVALLTIGGNDLLRGLAADTGAGMRKFETKLAAFLRFLRIGPCLSARCTTRPSATTAAISWPWTRGWHAPTIGG